MLDDQAAVDPRIGQLHGGGRVSLSDTTGGASRPFGPVRIEQGPLLRRAITQPGPGQSEFTLYGDAVRTEGGQRRPGQVHSARHQPLHPYRFVEDALEELERSIDPAPGQVERAADPDLPDTEPPCSRRTLSRDQLAQRSGIHGLAG
ncbi:hypothetical protein GCM10022295_88300 [Streptomyces osmaniensis]|uniref:Uncharacterized protein n=1 Tax=Streptomyces osmaniensis TaxID=593134 RepID=A0ABP6Z2E4_9ACTN